MGFYAKTLFLVESSQKADENGTNGERECVVWQDTLVGIDFGHITRLEKVVGEQYARLSHTPFRRAGICVADCFMTGLYKGLDEGSAERLAPALLIPAP